MILYDIPVHALSGEPSSLAPYKGKTVLIVNVASECGYAQQSEGLENLEKAFENRGFSVIGFASNRFKGQEPGTAEEIQTFCSTTFGVTFPLFEKIDVNGEDQHPIYAELTATADAEGYRGDVRWNFETFLVSPDASVQRFAPKVTTDDPTLVAAIEATLD
jgi:glutathione peroxidase